MTIIHGQAIEHIDDFDIIARPLCELEGMTYFPIRLWVIASKQQIHESDIIKKYIMQTQGTPFVYITCHDIYYIHPESIYSLFSFIKDKNEK